MLNITTSSPDAVDADRVAADPATSATDEAREPRAEEMGAFLSTPVDPDALLELFARRTRRLERPGG